jgi:hypothetical protein
LGEIVAGHGQWVLAINALAARAFRFVLAVAADDQAIERILAFRRQLLLILALYIAASSKRLPSIWKSAQVRDEHRAR